MSSPALYTYDQIIDDSWSHYFIIGMSVAAIFWAIAHAVLVEKAEMDESKVTVATLTAEQLEDPETKDLPNTPKAALDEMIKINGFIKDGAITFLKKEYLYLTIFCFVFGIVLLCTVD